MKPLAAVNLHTGEVVDFLTTDDASEWLRSRSQPSAYLIRPLKEGDDERFLAHRLSSFDTLQRAAATPPPLGPINPRLLERRLRRKEGEK